MTNGLTKAERAKYVGLVSDHGMMFSHEAMALSDKKLVFAVFPFNGNSTASAWYADICARGLAESTSTDEC